MTVGEIIKTHRKNQKITQEYLAEKMNVTRQAVSKWENGTALPNMENLIELAKIFQVPLSELTSTKEEKQEETEEIENKTEENEIEINKREEKEEEENKEDNKKGNKKKTIHGKKYSRRIIVGVIPGIVMLVLIFFLWKSMRINGETTMAGETKAGRDLTNDAVKEDDSGKLTFTFIGYTGYLDACSWCDLKDNFTGVDYDKDGLADRVYRSVEKDEKVQYKIEFGNGEVLKLGDQFAEWGFPYILSSDLTGDDKMDIIFGENYEASTYPEGDGSFVVYAQVDKGYNRLDMPFYGMGGAYEHCIPFTYEDGGNYNLLVKCEELGYETEIKIDRDIWNGYQYDSYFVGQEVQQSIYDVFVKEMCDGSNELTGKIRLVDKWNTDEVYVAIQYKKGKLIYKEIYQEDIDKTPQKLYLYNSSELSSIVITDGKTGKNYVVLKEKRKEFLEMLSETEWIEQEASGGIVDYLYKVTMTNTDGYSDEIIFRMKNILIYNGSCWETAGEEISLTDYLEEKNVN